VPQTFRRPLPVLQPYAATALRRYDVTTPDPKPHLASHATQRVHAANGQNNSRALGHQPNLATTSAEIPLHPAVEDRKVVQQPWSNKAQGDHNTRASPPKSV